MVVNEEGEGEDKIVGEKIWEELTMDEKYKKTLKLNRK
jgi:hypothetical protein